MHLLQRSDLDAAQKINFGSHSDKSGRSPGIQARKKYRVPFFRYIEA